MTDQNYLTIGELARRVGVTVRTIQYYDQQGLLSPSAKGPQNQRLYTDDNVKDLYRILTLKYLGLSLAQIKSDAALYRALLASATTLRLRRRPPRTKWRAVNPCRSGTS